MVWTSDDVRESQDRISRDSYFPGPLCKEDPSRTACAKGDRQLRSLGKYGVRTGAPLLSVVRSSRQHRCASISRLLSESPSAPEPESTGLRPSRQALCQLVGSGWMFTWGLVKSERGSKSLDPLMPAASDGLTPSTQSPGEMSPAQSCIRERLLRYGL